MVSLHSALAKIYSVRSDPSLLPLTTPKILRQELSSSHGMTWDDEEWKGGQRGQVLKVWEGVLQENREDVVESSHPVAGPSNLNKKKKLDSSSSKSKKGNSKPKEVIVLSSSQPHQEEEESEEEEEEEEKPAKKKRKTSTKKKEPKSKYDRAAEKNLGNFLDMALGGMMQDLVGGGAEDDYEDEEFDDEEAQEEEDKETPELILSDDTPPPAPPASSKKKKPRNSTASTASTSTVTTTKKRQTSKGKAKGKEKEVFKSTEFVQDSDDSSNEVLDTHQAQVGDGSKGKKKKALVVDSEGSDREEEENSVSDTVKKGKGKAKAKEVKEKKPRTKKEPVKKEGDAEKGTEAEEDRIKKLKNLLKLAGTPRPFTAQTGAERTLSVSTRFEILSNLLNELGLKVTGNGSSGKLPSEAKAKDIGEQREIEKESEALQGTSLKHLGSRSGRKRQNRPNHSSDENDEDDDSAGSSSASDADDKSSRKKKRSKAKVSRGAKGNGGGETPKRKKLEERKKFASFLGDQSESD